MATAEEVFKALNEKAGFSPDNENWTKDTFTWKDIAPGKVYLYFQTGTGKEYTTPNFGIGHENLDKRVLYNLRIELGNSMDDTPEDMGEAFISFNVEDIEDKSVDWFLQTMQEFERRVLWELKG